VALDPEQIVIAYLLADDTVNGITEEIVGRSPAKTDRSWARVWLLDDPSVDRNVDWLIKASLQIDCFSGTKGSQGDASQLSNAIREAIAAMPDADLRDAAVTSATSRRRRADDDKSFGKPMARYIITTVLHLHPR
jgi:hypothetical protein